MESKKITVDLSAAAIRNLVTILMLAIIYYYEERASRRTAQPFRSFYDFALSRKLLDNLLGYDLEAAGKHKLTISDEEFSSLWHMLYKVDSRYCCDFYSRNINVPNFDLCCIEAIKDELKAAYYNSMLQPGKKPRSAEYYRRLRLLREFEQFGSE